MERTLALDSVKKVGEKISLEGWVQTRRDHGKIVFIDLWDRSGLVQIVVKTGLDENVKPQTSVRIEGSVQERSKETVNPNLPTGTVEVVSDKVEILGQAAALPFDIDTDLQIETFLDNAALTLRSKKARATFRVQSAIARSFADFFSGQGFVQIQTPKIVVAATEGGTNLFEINYFDRKAYLAQSPQLYKQIMVGVFERVFEISPVFRAEPHSTTRHINEYVSLDMEMAFIKDHRDIIEMGNKFFRFLIEKLGELKLEFDLFGAKLPVMPETVPVLTLREAQELIKGSGGRDGDGEPDLEPGDERKLGEVVKSKFDSDFVWVTHYPTKKRAFYTKPDPANPELSLGVDLICCGAEVISGGQRINDEKELIEALKMRGINPDNFEFYRQAFRFGMPPEGGLAIGLERLTAQLLGLQNIRFATLFPRDVNRLTP